MTTDECMYGPTIQQLMQNDLMQASRFHRYSIFDWLLSQVTNYLPIKLDDLIAISFENGNIQAIVSLLNKDLGLPKYIEEYQCTHFAILASKELMVGIEFWI